MTKPGMDMDRHSSHVARIIDWLTMEALHVTPGVPRETRRPGTCAPRPACLDFVREARGERYE